MNGEKRSTVDRAGWWLLVEKDPYEADEYVFRSIFIEEKYVGNQFSQNCIYARSASKGIAFSFGGRFNAPQKEIDHVIQEVFHAAIDE